MKLRYIGFWYYFTLEINDLDSVIDETVSVCKVTIFVDGFIKIRTVPLSCSIKK